MENITIEKTIQPYVEILNNEQLIRQGKTLYNSMGDLEESISHEIDNAMKSIVVKEPFPTIPVSSTYLFQTIGIFKNKCKEYISLKVNDQDTIQKLTVLLAICMEFYRILMGSLLLSFVPQKCGDHICGITENISRSGAYYIVYIINLMTLCSFTLLYLVEIKRENRLITYLDVNSMKPTDAMTVAVTLRALPDNKRENILYIDKIYQQVGCCAISVYVFNTIISAVVIYANYLDNKTITAFLTNVLFMGSKISDVYIIANTDNNIFYSAYLKNKTQYNDVDPDKLGEDFGQMSITSSDE